MSKSPAFLVEGDMEQKFIQNICPRVPVQKINCNGDNVSMTAIAKRVGSLGRLLHRKNSPIIVIFDRERREQNPEDLKRELLERLREENVDAQIIVGIPDRDIENWILADYASFSYSAGLEGQLIPPPFEGKKGKAEIKKLLMGRPYIETVDGVSWLKSSRPDVMALNSHSFSLLLNDLRRLGCWWLDQKSLVETDSGDKSTS